MQAVFESESCSVVSDSLQPHGLYSLWNSPGQNTRMGSLFLLQGISPTQGSNPGLPHCRRADSLPAEPLGKLKNTRVGSPSLLQWIFPLNAGVSCIAGHLKNTSYLGTFHVVAQFLSLPLPTLGSHFFASNSDRTFSRR